MARRKRKTNYRTIRKREKVRKQLVRERKMKREEELRQMNQNFCENESYSIYLDNAIKTSLSDDEDASSRKFGPVFGNSDGGCNMFLEDPRKHNCTCISLTMLAKKQDNLEFTSQFIDSTLIEGETLYRYILQDLQNARQFYDNHSLFHELPSDLSLNNTSYHLTKLDRITGFMLDHSIETGHNSLEADLGKWAKCANSGLIMVNGFCSAIFRFKEQFWYFDSHSCSENDMPCAYAKACVSCASGKPDISRVDAKIGVSCDDGNAETSCADGKTGMSCVNEKAGMPCEDEKNALACDYGKDAVSCEDGKVKISCADGKTCMSCDDEKAGMPCEDEKNAMACDYGKDAVSCEDGKVKMSCADGKTGMSCDDQKAGMPCEDEKNAMACDYEKDAVSCEDGKVEMSCDSWENGMPCEDEKNAMACDYGKDAVSCEDRRPILVPFDSIVDLSSYLHQLYVRNNSSSIFQYEISPLIIVNTVQQNCKNEALIKPEITCSNLEFDGALTQPGIMCSNPESDEALTKPEIMCSNLELDKYAQRLIQMRKKFRQKYWNDEAFRNKIRNKRKEKYKKDKEAQEKKKVRIKTVNKDLQGHLNTSYREKYKNDLDFRERKKAREREKYKLDPDFRERAKAKSIAKYKYDLDFQKRVKARNKEKYKYDLDYQERAKARSKEKYKHDLDYQERAKARNKEKYKYDLDYQERTKARNKEKYKYDLDYQERAKAKNKEKYKYDLDYQEKTKARNKEKYKYDLDYQERAKARNKEKYKYDLDYQERTKARSKFQYQMNKDLKENSKAEETEIIKEKPVEQEVIVSSATQNSSTRGSVSVQLQSVRTLSSPAQETIVPVEEASLMTETEIIKEKPVEQEVIVSSATQNSLPPESVSIQLQSVRSLFSSAQETIVPVEEASLMTETEIIKEKPVEQEVIVSSATQNSSPRESLSIQLQSVRSLSSPAQETIVPVEEASLMTETEIIKEKPVEQEVIVSSATQNSSPRESLSIQLQSVRTLFSSAQEKIVPVEEASWMLGYYQ